MGILTPSHLNKIQKKMYEFQIPSNLGRILRKIHGEEGFSNFTVDQWWTFFTIYATVSLWDHLSVVDRKILTQFVRICSILVNRIVKTELVWKAHLRLIKLVKLIEKNYGCRHITSNLYLSFHLYKCLSNYRPLYAF